VADSKTTELPDAIAPNVQMSLAPNGYIRVVLGYDLLSSAFYIDGQSARVLAGHFEQAANAFDEAWAKIASMGKQDNDVLDLTAKLQELNDMDIEDIIALDAEFEVDVDSGEEYDSDPSKFDA
jgi:hypothetical protein